MKVEEGVIVFCVSGPFRAKLYLSTFTEKNPTSPNSLRLFCYRVHFKKICSGNSFFEHPAGFKFVDNISSMAQHDLSVII